MSKQKAVIKLGLPNAKNRSKAMQLASKSAGVNSVAITGADKDRLEVVGEGVDTVVLVNCLRKKVCSADIVVVEEVKDKKKEEEEKKKKEEEAKKKKEEEDKKKAEEAKKKAEEARKKAEEEFKKLWGACPPPPPPPPYAGGYYPGPPPPPTTYVYEEQPAGCHIM